MNCLHGKPAAYPTTSNGSFWFCNQNPTCNFFCVENEGYMYEKAINGVAVYGAASSAVWWTWQACEDVCGEGFDESELWKTVLRVWREGEAVFILDVGWCATIGETGVSSWITVCDSKGEKGGIE
jgi:hypothetical protein